MKKTAKLIKKLKRNFRGDARLYKVNPPMKYLEDDKIDDSKETKTSYVVISATVAMFSGAETYIFSADKNGDITEWSEMEGSYRGSLDHAKALRNAGYKIVKGGN